MKTITLGDIESLLKKAGFTFESQKGSHRKWCKESYSITTVMHRSPKEILSPGLMKAILKVLKSVKQ